MGKNQDPGSGINIPDPPHCYRINKTKNLLQFLQGVVPQEAEDIEVEEGGTAAQQQVGGGADLVASAIKLSFATKAGHVLH
jgi:hypothetical protein